MSNSFLRSLVVAALATTLCAFPARSDPPTFVERGYGPRIYPGDEDARLGRLHLVRGHFGLAERYYRRSVEATPQNGAAWAGLAAAYDGLGRFGLAERAYRRARSLSGSNETIENNYGYSQMLRGRNRRADRYYGKAQAMAPYDPTIANNRFVNDLGQEYFWGSYVWTPWGYAPPGL